VSEPEDVRGSTDREAGRTDTFYLLLGQPEIVSWLGLNKQELAAWLSPGGEVEDDDDDEEPWAA
jgi:hypothetical protein